MLGSFLLLLGIGLIFYSLFSVVLKDSERSIKIPKFENEKEKNSKKKKDIENNEDKTFLGTKGKTIISIMNKAKHIFVCGTTGSGKTVTLSNFIKSIFKFDYPALIVDGKGDTDKDSLLDIVTLMNKEHGNKRKVYIVNMNDPLTSDKYNPFNGKSPTVVKDMLISMTDWSEEHYKVNASRYIQSTIKIMLANEMELSFESIIDSLDTDEYKTLSNNLVKNETITKKEHLKNVKLAENSKDIINGAIARFSLLLESDIGIIFSNDGISIPKALNEKAIIVFLLNSLTYPEISPLLGRLITIDAKQGVSSLFHKLFKRVFFIFDEISEYVSSELLLLVNQSRSANVTSILASQSLSDIDKVSETLRKQVLENCNNYIVMRQNEPSNAEIWSHTIGTKRSIKSTRQFDEDGLGEKGSLRETREFIYHPDIIKNLDIGEAIYVSKDEKVKAKIKVNKPF